MDKTILITGASGGIGSQVAIQASRKGYICYITGRNEHRLRETFEALTGEGHRMFIRDLPDASKLDVKIDSLIHCAGVVNPLPCKYLTVSDFTDVFNINFIVPVLMTGDMIRSGLLKDGASVIFISSEAVNTPYPGGAMLAASKAALEAYAKTLRLAGP